MRKFKAKTYKSEQNLIIISNLNNTLNNTNNTIIELLWCDWFCKIISRLRHIIRKNVKRPPF